MGHHSSSPSSIPTYQSYLASSMTTRDPSSLRARHLKRSPAHLSVCLRPTPSKRLKPMNRNHVEADSTTMSASSTDFAVRRLHRTRRKSTQHLSTSGGPIRANAEQWFNDSSQNPIDAPHASFIDGKRTTFSSICEAQIVQMILPSISMNIPRRPWIAPVRFNRTGTPKAGGTLPMPTSSDGKNRAIAPVRNFEG